MTIQKCKVFGFRYSQEADAIETEINRWLEQNPNVEIAHINTTSESGKLFVIVNYHVPLQGDKKS